MKTHVSRHAFAPVAVVVAAAVVIASAATGDASTPAQGAVSDSTRSVGWGGGPFVAPNISGTGLDAPDCSAPDSCDDFELTVSTTAGYGKAHQLAIDVTWTNSAADFDV